MGSGGLQCERHSIFDGGNEGDFEPIFGSETKFWIEPAVSLAYNKGLTKRQLNALTKLVEDRRDEIRQAWQEHFGS
jgi:hypothetical protein